VCIAACGSGEGTSASSAQTLSLVVAQVLSCPIVGETLRLRIESDDPTTGEKFACCASFDPSASGQTVSIAHLPGGAATLTVDGLNTRGGQAPGNDGDLTCDVEPAIGHPCASDTSDTIGVLECCSGPVQINIIEREPIEQTVMLHPCVTTTPSETLTARPTDTPTVAPRQRPTNTPTETPTVTPTQSPTPIPTDTSTAPPTRPLS
jgi:hypothetical protein